MTCLWCKRLCTRNWRWDRHCDYWAMRFIFKYTMKSVWHKNWYIRKDWRRWTSEFEDVRRVKRHTMYRGVGQRYYWRE